MQLELSKSDIDLILNQIKYELEASHQYLYLYTVLSSRKMNYEKFAAYFKHESENEKEHALKLIDYLNNRGVCVDLTEISAPIKVNINSSSYMTVIKCFELALETEQKITTNIMSVYENLDDTDTVLLLEDMVSEQFTSMAVLEKHLSCMREFTSRHEIMSYSI